VAFILKKEAKKQVMYVCWYRMILLILHLFYPYSYFCIFIC